MTPSTSITRDNHARRLDAIICDLSTLKQKVIFIRVRFNQSIFMRGNSMSVASQAILRLRNRAEL